MAKDGKGGGSVGRLWRKHGGGYYALLAVGTWVYLEIRSLVESIASAGSVGDFVTSELVTFAVETVMNALQASWWPVTWYVAMGIQALYWAAGGYLVWALFLAILLERRERQYKAELGL